VMRRLSSLAATSAAAILMAGGLALSAGATAAHASTEFTCEPGETCFFTGENLNGTASVIQNSAYAGGAEHSFASIGIADPGSVHIDGGSTLTLIDKELDITECVYNGTLTGLFGDYGYFKINYGVEIAGCVGT
jgi:hypothetical protein